MSAAKSMLSKACVSSSTLEERCSKGMERVVSERARSGSGEYGPSASTAERGKAEASVLKVGCVVGNGLPVVVEEETSSITVHEASISNACNSAVTASMTSDSSSLRKSRTRFAIGTSSGCVLADGSDPGEGSLEKWAIRQRESRAL